MRFDQFLSSLEATLGPPEDPAHVLSWSKAVERDESEEFPQDAMAFLAEKGLHAYQVPGTEGGRLGSLEELYALSRALGRRDPSVALTFAMKTWSQLLWMAGTPQQRRWAADLILNRGGSFCLAASEAEHGADLLASEVTARQEGQGWAISGRKWPIGLAGRAEAVLVLARDGNRTGPRGLSWYLLDRASVAREQLEATPKIRTLGMRAAELRGLEFRDAKMPAHARVGAAGAGLELTLKLFQITRTLVPGFGVGAADTVLRLAARFALERKLYGKSAVELSVVREKLAAAYLDWHAADALMRSSVRALHVCPHEASVSSLIAKAFVPHLTGRAIRAAVEVLGARYYLREGQGSGVVQKLVRDHAVLELFDGSSTICLAGLAVQLPALLRGSEPQPVAANEARIDFCRELPAFEPGRLELIARGHDSLCQRMGSAGELGDGPALELLSEWHARYDALGRLADRISPKSVEAVEPAWEYCTLHAAAACAGLDQNLLPGALARLLRPRAPAAHFVSLDQIEEFAR